MKQAKEYARLIRIRGDHVDVCRVRMFDGHNYNWHQLVCSDGKLHCPTDQSYDLESNHISDINFWDEIWLDGVRIHKKSWWRKVIFWMHKKQLIANKG